MSKVKPRTQYDTPALSRLEQLTVGSGRKLSLRMRMMGAGSCRPPAQASASGLSLRPPAQSAAWAVRFSVCLSVCLSQASGSSFGSSFFFLPPPNSLPSSPG